MTDAFAELVMPIFRKGIDLQDKLSRGEQRALQDVKRQVSGLVEEARRCALGVSGLKRSYDLARFGLVAWIDEVLTDSAWGRGVGWKDHSLEWDLFSSQDRATIFYDEWTEAERAGDLDAMEVYLLAVTLGFRGKYRGLAADDESRMPDLEQSRAGFADATGALVYNDDGGLAEWVQRVYNRVSGAGGIPDRPFAEDPPYQDRFGPLRGPVLLLTVSILVSVTVLITLAAYLFAVHVDLSAGSPGSTASRVIARPGISVGQAFQPDDAIPSGWKA